jgi:hypothetical protein
MSVKIPIVVSFDLSDYFSKFGFGDGDDSAALEFGYQYRELAIEIINRNLERVGTWWRATEWEVSSMHNNCLIKIPDIDGVGDILSFFNFELEDGVVADYPDNMSEDQKKFCEIWPIACREFDAEVGKREG